MLVNGRVAESRSPVVTTARTRRQTVKPYTLSGIVARVSLGFLLGRFWAEYFRARALGQQAQKDRRNYRGRTAAWSARGRLDHGRSADRAHRPCLSNHHRASDGKSNPRILKYREEDSPVPLGTPLCYRIQLRDGRIGDRGELRRNGPDSGWPGRRIACQGVKHPSLRFSIRCGPRDRGRQINSPSIRRRRFAVRVVLRDRRAAAPSDRDGERGRGSPRCSR